MRVQQLQSEVGKRRGQIAAHIHFKIERNMISNGISKTAANKKDSNHFWQLHN